MKKLFTLVAALLLAATVWAQSGCPQRISYQAVVRNQADQLVVGTSGIQVTVTIKEGTTTKYVETHNVTSNQNGLISLTVGEGTAQAPYTTMENIDWSNATMVTVVAVPGEAPVEASTPVTAVPYALYSCEINPGSKTITNIYEHIGDTLNNYYTKSETKVQIASDIHDSIVNNISTQIHDTVMNHLTEYEIKDCNDVKNCVAPQIKDSLVNYLTIDGLCDSIKNNCSVAFTDERNTFIMKNRFEKVVILEEGAVQPDGTIRSTDSLNSVNGKDLVKYTGNVIHDSIVNNISTQIHDTVMNHLTEYEIKDCDDVVACPIIKNMRDSIQINRASISNNYNRIQTNITNIQSNRDTIRIIVANLRDTINKTVLDSIKYYNSEMNLAIDTIVKNIVHDSIVNNISIQIHDTVMNHLTEYEIKNCNDVKNCVAPQIQDSLVNYLTIDGLCDSIKNNCSVAFTDERNVFTKRNRFERVVILEKGAVQPDGTIRSTDSLNSVNGKDLVKYTGNVIHDSIVNNISTQIHDTVMNHLNEYEIKDCDDVVACPIIKNMRDSIQINRSSINRNFERIQSNRDTIREVARSISNAEIVIKQGDVEVKKFTLNQTEKDTIKLPAFPKQKVDLFTATAGQTGFTLSKTPNANTLVKMYINGVMVGGAGEGFTDNPVISISGTAVTYTSANNKDACSNAYTLKAGDRVIFEYWY